MRIFMNAIFWIEIYIGFQEIRFFFRKGVLKDFILAKKPLPYFPLIAFFNASNFDLMDIWAILHMYGACWSDAAAAHKVKKE